MHAAKFDVTGNLENQKGSFLRNDLLSSWTNGYIIAKKKQWIQQSSPWTKNKTIARAPTFRGVSSSKFPRREGKSAWKRRRRRRRPSNNDSTMISGKQISMFTLWKLSLTLFFFCEEWIAPTCLKRTESPFAPRNCCSHCWPACGNLSQGRHYRHPQLGLVSIFDAI